MKNNYYRLFPMFLCIITLFMGIGYASINSISLALGGNLVIEGQYDIFISDVTYYTDSTSSAVINSYNRTLLNTMTILEKDVDATVTYEITVTNNTNASFMLAGILGSEDGNGLFYDNDNIKCSIKSLSSVPTLLPNDDITFEVVFEYADNVDVNSSDFNNVLNSYIGFDFKKLYKISYEDIVDYDYVQYVVEGESVNIEFINDIPFDVYVEGSSSYTYNKPNLVINEVLGDITIKGLAGFEYLSSYEFTGDNYLDTGVLLFSEENVNKNFELSFTIEEIDDYTEQFSTLVNALYESDTYSGFVFRVFNSQYEFVANTDVVNDSLFFDFDQVYKVTIRRIDNSLYYRLNDDEEFLFAANYANFTNNFDISVVFGAALDEYGYPFRFFTGTLSNMYVKFLPDDISIN